MEVSGTPLAESVKLPRLVRQLDWSNIAWPHQLRRSGVFPHVQLYCLMSAEGALLLMFVCWLV